jgi:hypothetical protein
MKCPTMGKRELVKSISSRKTGHQVDVWDCHPTVKKKKKKKKKKTLTQNCSYLKQLQGPKNRKEPGGKKVIDRHKLGSSSRGGSKARYYYCCYGVLTDRSLACLPSERPNKQLTVRSRYLHPTNRQMLGTSVTELGKNWKKLRGQLLRKISSLN